MSSAASGHLVAVVAGGGGGRLQAADRPNKVTAARGKKPNKVVARASAAASAVPKWGHHLASIRRITVGIDLRGGGVAAPGGSGGSAAGFRLCAMVEEAGLPPPGGFPPPPPPPGPSSSYSPGGIPPPPSTTPPSPDSPPLSGLPPPSNPSVPLDPLTPFTPAVPESGTGSGPTPLHKTEPFDFDAFERMMKDRSPEAMERRRQRQEEREQMEREKRARELHRRKMQRKAMQLKALQEANAKRYAEDMAASGYTVTGTTVTPTASLLGGGTGAAAAAAADPFAVAPVGSSSSGGSGLVPPVPPPLGGAGEPNKWLGGPLADPVPGAAAGAPPFGQQQQQSAPFGQPQQSAPFGQLQQSAPYGQLQQSASFGQPQQNAPYGQQQLQQGAPWSPAPPVGGDPLDRWPASSTGPADPRFAAPAAPVNGTGTGPQWLPPVSGGGGVGPGGGGVLDPYRSAPQDGTRVDPPYGPGSSSSFPGPPPPLPYGSGQDPYQPGGGTYSQNGWNAPGSYGSAAPLPPAPGGGLDPYQPGSSSGSAPGMYAPNGSPAAADPYGSPLPPPSMGGGGGGFGGGVQADPYQPGSSNSMYPQQQPQQQVGGPDGPGPLYGSNATLPPPSYGPGGAGGSSGVPALYRPGAPAGSSIAQEGRRFPMYGNGPYFPPVVYPASTQATVSDDLHVLLEVLPAELRGNLLEHPRRGELLELVLDLGRRPEARFLGGGEGEYWRRSEISRDDLDTAVAAVGEFGWDNRAGVEGTLHRISAIRSRRGDIVGLTCRVGRAVTGQADMLRDVLNLGQSILILGKPGVGKTTVIREIARVLSDDLEKRVVIVDTSNEIGGDGDVPHPAIGGARRMQVPNPSLQHKVMVEAVENHMPEVVIVDEIGTEAEALACRTIAERGVMLVGTAHGQKLENIIKNPTLCDLVGGIQSVTLGDEAARSRGTRKSVLERKAPPTFPLLIEMRERHHWVAHQTDRSVDCLLHGRRPFVEVRSRDSEFKVVIEKKFYDSNPNSRMGSDFEAGLNN